MPAKSNVELLKRTYAVLLAGARSVSPHLSYDGNGYAPDFRQNLMSGLPLPHIVGDLNCGAGRELSGKLRAAHSSAALAVNTFGPFRVHPMGLTIAKVTCFQSIRFEATCPTGLGGTPPHLDVLADGELPVAVESKCTEWMSPKAASFSESYDRLQLTHGHSPWFGHVSALRLRPERYCYLDAAQLVKHAFGLLSLFGTRNVKLVYLYWEPRNSDRFEECACHRAEAEDLASSVRGCTVELLPMSYRELWAEWEAASPPPHLEYLRRRYDREV